MFKSLNKAISTPIAIIIVVVLAGFVIGTVLACQYYWQPLEKETETETETSVDEMVDFNNIAKSFCESKKNVVRYSSLINFDQDKEKEIILMCTSNGSSWKSGDLGPLDLYVLNKENGNYQSVWNKNTNNDFDFMRVYEPKIIDVDKDGIDEIVLSGSSHGGTCTGEFFYYFLYSSKYNELFLGTFGRGGKGYVSGRSGSFIIFEEADDYWPCPEYDEGIKIAYLSNNLKKLEYQVFRTYLEGLLWEKINKVSVE